MPIRIPLANVLLCCAAIHCTSICCTAAAEENVSGDAVIRAPAGNSEIVVTTTSRVAGAIHSLTWDGCEFIDSFDHGRQLQSASNFDSGRRFIPEVFNPTEAGSMRDGAGPTSSSKLLRFSAKDNELRTVTQMAFWLAPGEKSQGHPARNETVLSNHLLTKHVRIGYEDLPSAIEYTVTFTVPKGEHHTYAQFEALTGYMPPAFSRCWKWIAPGKLAELDWTAGEQPHPVILATEGGTHAMGVYSPDQPSPGFENAGYGRFRFEAEKVNKWNCVFRSRDRDGIKPGEYTFKLFVLVGSLDDVTGTIARLQAKLGKKS